MDPNERLDLSDMDNEAIQSDRAVDLLARNKQQAEEIAALKTMVVENQDVADLYIKQLKKRIKDLKAGNAANKIKLTEVLTQIDKLRSSNREALEQIWNNLKSVKIYF